MHPRGCTHATRPCCVRAAPLERICCTQLAQRRGCSCAHTAQRNNCATIQCAARAWRSSPPHLVGGVGLHSLLRGFRGHPRHGRRHVVLFAVGTWYNLNSGDPTSACIGSTNLLTGSHTRICSRKARTAALPNHSAPASTVALPGFADPKRWMFQEMHYPWARRAQGSLGLEDLSEDLETLMTAFGRWQAELPFDVLAAEGMPQHWNAAPLTAAAHVSSTLRAPTFLLRV